jgi:hypothetical protein
LKSRGPPLHCSATQQRERENGDETDERNTNLSSEKWISRSEERFASFADVLLAVFAFPLLLPCRDQRLIAETSA